MTYISNVTTLNLDVEKCIGCKMCITVCPHEVFRIENKKAKIISKDLCMECGACQKNCPAGAITVKSGVGCAAGVIAGVLNKKNAECCCAPQSTNCC